MPTKKSILAIKNKSNPSYSEKLLFIKEFDLIKIRKNKKNFTPAEKTQLTKRFKKLKRFVTNRVTFQRLTNKQLAALNNKKVNKTKLGIFIARPLNNRGEPIPGVRIRVNKNGTQVISKGARIDYIVPLSKSEVIELIRSKPTLNNVVIKRKLDENPGLARKYRAANERNRHIQLIFTTHRSVLFFKTIGSLIFYIENMNNASREEITGLVFTIFTPPKGKQNAKKKDTKKKRNNRR